MFVMAFEGWDPSDSTARCEAVLTKLGYILGSSVIKPFLENIAKKLDLSAVTPACGMTRQQLSVYNANEYSRVFIHYILDS